MGRKILFITTDQMRFDAIGANGGKVAATPAIDALASGGINYTRAHNQNVVCMPARSTMITGQYVSTHGVWMNGVPLPVDAPSVARYLHDEGGYRTALIGKAHFEPYMDFKQQFYESQMSRKGEHGPHRGFEHMELATHSPMILHYSDWVKSKDPDAIGKFYQNLDDTFNVNAEGGGETGGCQLHFNSIPRELYHTDWVADRTIDWLKTVKADEDWFCWMSFPDPHHPWDPPQSELGRHPWRDTPLPEFYPGSKDKIEAILKDKPQHWLEWYNGTRVTNYEAPPKFRAADMTADQVQEINAFTHVENELIDEAIAKVMAEIARRGWGDDVDVVFTTDHGEFQGEFGLLFKGPYHVDALMRLPMIWRPAKSAGVTPASVKAPVGQVDLAPTFCEIAGLPVPEWMQGKPMPKTDAHGDKQGRERVFTEWDCTHIDGTTVGLRTIYRDGYTITSYLPGTIYDGSEGELYDHKNDPQQWRNLWNDPASASLKSDLLADLKDSEPPVHNPKLECVAPV